MLATVAAADSASTVRKKYSVLIYNEAEPPAMYAIYKQTLTLCVLQYLHMIKIGLLFYLSLIKIYFLCFHYYFYLVSACIILKFHE